MFATHFVGGRFALLTIRSECHSRNVRNVFILCMLHIRRVKVWFLHYKSMVFGVQKGGFYIAKVWFLFLNVALLQSVCSAFAECSPTLLQIVRYIVAIHSPCIRNLFATLLQSVCHVFAPHKQRCCNLFASKKPKPSMCIEEFRPPKYYEMN